MDTADLSTIRSFNRTVTERLGVLEDGYLRRDRPVGASRLLWEIGRTGDVVELRARLGLDSGYVSRLLRRLEADGMVEVADDPDDRRRRVATLTRAGRRERAELDRLSDELAASLVGPLAAERRRELVAAMATVERLLRAGEIVIEPEQPDTADARFCLRSYYEVLDDRFPGGFDPEAALQVSPDDMRAPGGLLLLARRRGEPVGCGVLKLRGDGWGEIKRVWVAESVRGLGLGRRLLGELEAAAIERGLDTVRLDTNASLVEAIALYRSAGYVEIDPFTDEPYAHHWFEKRLDGSPTVG